MAAPSLPDRLVALGRFLEIQNLGLNLPFALAFLWVATRGHPALPTTVLIVVAFVAARNAGHSFNRWTDRDLDARNPRTAGRLLVTHPRWAPVALAFAVGNAGLLAVCAYLLNPLALLLVPVALAIVLGYSLTKRVTSLTTLFLGLVEAITPAAVYIAATGTFPLAAAVATVGVFAYGVAFELIHSLGDLEADRALGLHSLPQRLGREGSWTALALFHAGAVAAFAVFGYLAGLGPLYFLVLAALALGAALIERAIRRDPGATLLAFRAHFLLAGLFLVGALLGFAA